MSTSRKFKIETHLSSLVRESYFGVVTNAQRTRHVHMTGMYNTRHFARAAAKKWATTSQSMLARSLSFEE